MKLSKKQKIRCILWIMLTIVISTFNSYIGMMMLEKFLG